MRSLAAVLFVLASCASATLHPAATATTTTTTTTAAAVSVPDALRAVVDAPDRSAADRALDAGRHGTSDRFVLRFMRP